MILKNEMLTGIVPAGANLHSRSMERPLPNLGLLINFAEKAQQSIQGRVGMRWTTRDVEVDRQEIANSLMGFRAVAEGSASDGTRPAGDDQLWLGDGGVGVEQRALHVFGDRPRDHDSIGVAR